MLYVSAMYGPLWLKFDLDSTVYEPGSDFLRNDRPSLAFRILHDPHIVILLERVSSMAQVTHKEGTSLLETDPPHLS